MFDCVLYAGMFGVLFTYIIRKCSTTYYGIFYTVSSYFRKFQMCKNGLIYRLRKLRISVRCWNSGQVWALSIRRSTINNRIVMFMYESAIQLRVLDLFNWVAIFETRLFLKIRNGGLHSQFNYDHENPKLYILHCNK